MAWEELERLLRSSPERYVSDPEGLADATLHVKLKKGPMKQHVDPVRYEAVYSERPAPGEYQVVTRGPDRRPTTKVVISIPKLGVEKKVLRIEYQVRVPELEVDAAVLLIVEKVLRELLLDHHAENARTIELRDLKTGTSRRMPYPR
jgi:hypothetical protein